MRCCCDVFSRASRASATACATPAVTVTINTQITIIKRALTRRDKTAAAPRWSAITAYNASMVSAYAVARAVSSSEASREGGCGVLEALVRVRRSSSINAAAKDCGCSRWVLGVARAASRGNADVAGVVAALAAFVAFVAFVAFGVLGAFDAPDAFDLLDAFGALGAFGAPDAPDAPDSFGVPGASGEPLGC